MAKSLHKKPTAEMIVKARKAGVRVPMPSKPNGSATLNQLDKFVDRFNTWCDKIHAGVKKFDKDVTERDRRRKLADKIRSI